jgi:hypothetical protein
MVKTELSDHLMEREVGFSQELRSSRSENRYRCENITVEIRVSHCEDHPELTGESFVSEACDVSAHGMRITSGIQLPPGTEVNATVHWCRYPATQFVLFGTVCWEFKEGGLLVKGLRLEDSPSSDYSRWVAAIESHYCQK